MSPTARSLTTFSGVVLMARKFEDFRVLDETDRRGTQLRVESKQHGTRYIQYIPVSEDYQTVPYQCSRVEKIASVG